MDTATERQPRHLWEYEHPYYCNEGNFYQRGCHATFDSWADFIAAEGDADPDLNLVFRWDWKQGANQDTLLLFYMGQRKALCRSVGVRVWKDDEPAIREWLIGCANHMRKLWEPLIPSLEELPVSDGPDAWVSDKSDAKTGDCESCSSEGVAVRPYQTSNASQFKGATRWLCEICAQTFIGNWTEWEHHRDRAEIGAAIANAANRAIKAVESAGGTEERANAIAALAQALAKASP